MLQSLYAKLATVLLGLFCVTGLFFISLTVFSTEMYQSEINQKLNLKLAENIISEKLLLKNNRINEEALKEIFHMLMVINPSIELYLLDPRGRILAYSAPPGKVKLKHVDLKVVHSWFSENHIFPLRGDDPRNPDKKKAITIARIPKEGPLEGYLYVILGGEIYDGVMQKLKGSYILQVSFWAIIAAILFAVLAGFIVFAFLTKRLTRLAIAMDAFKSGSMTGQIQISRRADPILSDEIDRLGETFLRMAKHIETQMQEIQKSDTLRRELVANISHDLRTPIATLQGYIETMLIKKDTLAPEERTSYLQNAIKHCERLNKLVEDLFELAKLDSSETSPSYELFSLSDLAQDIFQKFELTAEKKNINMRIDIEGDLPFANADIGLIERALENLIENAICYTPAGGSIYLKLSPDNNDIAVQVIDNGPGIPEEELPNIFNRFYKLDKSGKDPSGHSGLGLAITKRILELHERTINVASSLNSGTTFTFHIPSHRPNQP